MSTPPQSNSPAQSTRSDVFLPRRARALRRVFLWVVAGLVAVTLLYLAGMNVFLRSRLFRDAISADSGAIRVDYASAYSQWPGRIHVDGLAIRGRDSNVEWILAIDHCDFRESFLDLLRRRFHASHVRGNGLSLRVRQRLEEKTPAEAALPPVPGFMDPPLAEVGPEPAPLTDANYRLWSIELDDVVAEHVRELWIDTVRLTGDLRIEGRWLFRPIRTLEIGPATIDLRSASAFYGPSEPLALDVHGTMVVTVHPADIREDGGTAIADHLAVDADLRGAVLPEPLVERLAGGHAAKGMLAAWTFEPMAAHVVADHTSSTVVIDVPEAVAVTRRPLRDLLPLPDGLDVEAKSATASAHAEIDRASRSLKAHLAVLAPGVKIRTGDDSMTGLLAVDVDARARDSVVDLSGTTAAFTADSPERSAEPADKRDKPEGGGWWVRVRLADARLTTAEGVPRFRAALSATARDASPVSAFLAKVTPLPRWLVDAVPTKDLRVEGEIRARPSVFEVQSVKARSDGSSVDFEFEKLAYWKEWALFLEAGPVHAGVRSGDGGTEVVPFNARPWFEGQAAAFRTNASRVR